MQKNWRTLAFHSAGFLCLFLSAVGIYQARAQTPVGFDPAPLLKQASELLDQGRLLECVDAYNTIAQYSPTAQEKAFALVRMADVMALFLDRKEEALKIYERAIHDYPGQPALENALFNMSMILYEQGRLQRAQDGFVRFLKEFPNSPRSFTASYMAERIATEQEKSPQEAPKSAANKKLQSAPNVRVALAIKKNSVSFTLHSQTKIAGQTKNTLPPGTYTATIHDSQIQLAGKSYRHSINLLMQTPFSMERKTYAGNLQLYNDSGKISAINILSLETYLQGVVPKEMSPSWEEQALMAQAVAARSYAWFLVGKMQEKPFDVAATTASQVYGGTDVGNTKTQKAVDSTRGLIVTEDSKPILTYFHAHSGGMLEDDANVWTADMPYYQVADDTVSQSVKHLPWEATISEADVVAALQRNGFKVATVRNIQPDKVSPSGRLVTVSIQTDTKRFSIKANTLRLWLGPSRIKSVLCSINPTGGGFTFSGAGYGHGVGMSQWGAQGMAKQGRDFRAILRHYYPGTTLTRIY
ncbi:MAG: SpoIID/LytB domain-containing protein [Desulfovibrio sp.]|uniref:SpoIID/LytB domain-containing protein n=1 Tax=Desulfovibrio sp. 7SRBS1 TaxID=3378064 RepID=UPI003B404A54